MKTLASKLNLKLGQIYKWNWDRKMSLEKYFMRSPFASENKNSLFKVFRPKQLDQNGNPVIFLVTKEMRR